MKKTLCGTTLALLLGTWAHAAPIAAKDLPPLVPGTLDWDYIGNSFSDFADNAENGVGRWVQNFVDEIEVTPDGTVVVGSDWDEGGRCLGLYKDGRPSGAALGKNDRKGGHRNGGWGTSTSAMTVVGNEILCARNDGEFYRFGWTPGDIESPRFRDGFVNGFGDTMNDKSATKVIGMNSRGNLVAIVLANGLVEVRERKGWAVVQRFAAPGVQDVAWGADDRLWLATADAVREVDVMGQATGRTAPDPGTPSAIAVSPQGELVVCDDGPRQQIRFYAIAGPDVRLVGTFGQSGGISAGTAGEPLPDKLMRPAGANRDAAGNLYVLCVMMNFRPRAASSCVRLIQRGSCAGRSPAMSSANAWTWCRQRMVPSPRMASVRYLRRRRVPGGETGSSLPSRSIPATNRQTRVTKMPYSNSLPR